MQLCPAYKNIIYFLSVKPFMVLFWLNYQIHIHNDHWEESNSCLYVDAPRNFLRKIISIDEKKSVVIYLYESVVLKSSGQYAIAYMFSESHNANTIGFFFKGNNSFCSAFSQKSCIQHSIKDAAVALTYTIPPCYIRLYVAHFKYNVDEAK